MSGPLFTPRQAMHLLGVSRHQLNQLMAEGLLDAIRLGDRGRTIRFPPAAVLRTGQLLAAVATVPSTYDQGLTIKHFPPELHRALKALATAEGLPLYRYVSEILAAHVAARQAG